MPHEVRGVVARSKGAPVGIETVLVPDPGPGEALVRVQACVRCATPTSTTARARSTTTSRSCSVTRPPGRSRRSGDGVTSVAPGDYVVIAWRAPCGNCRSCRRGRPWYCFDSRNATQPMTLADGTPSRPRSASAPSPR